MVTRVSSPAFIGRAAELQRFAAALEEARAGRPTVVLVAGEAGVGKTRLLNEVAQRARVEGAQVLEGGCIQLGAESLPFGPIVEILRRLAQDQHPPGLADLLGPGGGALARLVPELSRGVGTPVAGSSMDSASQVRLFEQFLSLLDHLARRAPLLVILEDLHWADRSTLELVGFLVRNVREGAIQLVASYRSDELHRRHPLRPFLAELERGGRAEPMVIARFDRAEMAEQLDGILGGRAQLELVDRIYTRSDGNAFYAEELLAGSSSVQLGETLRDVLLARVATLSEPSRELMRVASVAGSRISRSLLASVSGIDERDLDAALREAVDRYVLAPLEGGRVEQYAFRHALVREAVYGDLLAGERNRLHARYAGVLADTAEPEADAFLATELAHHWYMAHDLPRAFDASIRAGISAQAIYAYREATAQFERALELWDQIPDAAARAPLDRIGLLERAARVTWYFAPASSVGYTNAALALVDPVADAGRAALLHGLLSGARLFGLLDHAGALAAVRDGVRIVPADPPSAERARALASLARMLMHHAQHTESATVADEAVSIARAAGARDTEAHALSTRGVALATFGDLDAGIATIGLARTMYTELDNANGVNETLIYEADVLFAAGRYEEAAAAGLLAADHASHHGLAAILGAAALDVTFDALFAVGRWDEAAHALARAKRYGLHAIGDLEVEERRARLEVARGEVGAAGLRLERLRPLTVGIQAPKVIAPFTISLAEFEILRGHPLAARTAVGEGMRKVDAASDVWIGHIGPVLSVGIRAEADLAAQAAATGSKLELGESRAAGAAILDRMETLAREVAQLRPLYGPQAEAWRLMCEAEASRLTGVGEPDRWAAAGVAWAELRMPYEQAYTLMREGQAALAARDRRRAADALDAGLLIAIQLGARPLQHEIEELGRRAGIRLMSAADQPAPEGTDAPENPNATRDGIPRVSSGAATRGYHDLTPREQEVLKLVAAGRSDREIAAALFISPKTASVHVANIKGKLGADSRVAIVTDAIRLGLVEAPSTGPM